MPKIDTPWDVERLMLNWDYFLDAFWKEMRLPAKALTDYERMAFRFGATGPARRVLMGTRQLGKTTGLTAPLPCWRWLRDPNREIIISSKNDREVIKLAAFIRQALSQCTFLRHLAPRGKDLDNRTAFNIAGRRPGKQPSLMVGSIASALEGGRAHTIIADDIETKKNAMTPEAREELQRQTAEFTNIIYTSEDMGDEGCIDPPEILIIQTPKHDDSIAARFDKKRFAVRSYPLCLPKADEPQPFKMDPDVTAYAHRHHIKPGQSLMPLRFPESEVAKRRLEGPIEFYRESQCAVDLKNQIGYPLRLEDLVVMTLPPPPSKLPASVTWGKSNHNGGTRVDMACIGHGEDALYGPAFIDKEFVSPTAIKAAIDPGAARMADRTGLAIGASAGGFIYVYRVEGLPGGFDEASIEQIVLLLKEHHVQEVTLEINMDTAMVYQNTLRKMIVRHAVPPGDAMYPHGWSCKIVEKRNLTKKEERICNTLGAVMMNHRLIVNAAALVPRLVGEDDDVDIKNELQHQLANITPFRKSLAEDGKVDALEMLVDSFKNTQKFETDEARQRNLERDRQKELDRINKQMRKMLGIGEQRSPYQVWH